MKNICSLPFYVCAILLLVIGCQSCSAVHKLFTKRQVKLDSTTVSKVDSVVKKGIDTTKVISFRVDSSHEVIIELDTSEVDNMPILTGKSIYRDNMPVLIETDTMPSYYVQYDPKTHTVISNRPITKVTIKGTSDVAYSNFTGGVDTTLVQVARKDSTHINKNETVIERKKDKTSLPIWIYIIPILLIVLYLIYRNRDKIKSLALKLFTGI